MSRGYCQGGAGCAGQSRRQCENSATAIAPGVGSIMWSGKVPAGLSAEPISEMEIVFRHPNRSLHMAKREKKDGEKTTPPGSTIDKSAYTPTDRNSPPSSRQSAASIRGAAPGVFATWDFHPGWLRGPGGPFGRRAFTPRFSEKLRRAPGMCLFSKNDVLRCSHAVITLGWRRGPSHLCLIPAHLLDTECFHKLPRRTENFGKFFFSFLLRT